MADIKKRRPQNEGEGFYVDETCIDCDTCRWMAPGVYKESGGKSAVYRQPLGADEERRALEALVACPTASIGTSRKNPRLAEVVSSFPIRVEDNVYHCGYHSEKSFGAASYLIQRKEGNILIDSPRFAAPLVRNLEKMGGVRYLYLTHRDDVADHENFRRHFKCERVLHEADVTTETRGIEIKIRSEEPHALDDGCVILSVPGHTRGHTVLLYRDKFLFTGDHLAYSEDLGHLYAFRSACWYSWARQIQSMETLKNHSFEWVLPGHGRRFHAEKDEMNRSLARCIDWMKKT